MKFLRQFNRDGLLSHSLLVLFLLHIGSAANLLFHMAMGRLLDPAEYGVLAAMLGAFLMFFTPLFFSIQNTLSHFSRHLASAGRLQDVRFLAWRWTKKCLLIGTPFLFVVMALSRPLAAQFHLDTPLPVLLVAVILFVSILMPVFAGAFQGLEKFTWMAASSHSWTVIRLLVSIPMVLCVAATADGVLAAHLLGALLCVLIGIRALCRTIPDPEPTGQPLEKAGGYFFGSLCAIFFYSVLMNADIVMVKLFFPDEAVYGPYARASVIGRLIVFLSQPLAGALFPKVVARQGMTLEALGALLRAVALSALLVGAIAGLFSLAPQLPLVVLFGEFSPSVQTVQMTRLVVWAMAPLGLVFLIMNFELAQNRFSSLVPLGMFAVLFVAGFSLYHPSPLWAAVWLLAASLASALALTGLVVWQKKGFPLQSCRNRLALNNENV